MRSAAILTAEMIGSQLQPGGASQYDISLHLVYPEKHGGGCDFHHESVTIRSADGNDTQERRVAWVHVQWSIFRPDTQAEAQSRRTRTRATRRR
jgi:hypothetical protein